MILSWSAYEPWRCASGCSYRSPDQGKVGRAGARDITFGFLMPGDPSVQMRAAMVARLAGRVAELASDLQVLAMLLQVPPEDDASLAERSEVDPGTSTVDVVALKEPPAQPHEILGPDQRADPVPEIDDPFVRAARAIEALRGALRPDEEKSDRPHAGAIG